MSFVVFAITTALTVCIRANDDEEHGKETDPAVFRPKGDRKQAIQFKDYRINTYAWFPSEEEGGFPFWQLEVLKGAKRVYAYQTGAGSLRLMGDEEGESLFEVGAEIAGPGLPTAVVFEWSGGAHCCATFHFLQLSQNFKKISDLDAADSDILNASKEGGVFRFRQADWTFAYFRTAFAFSPVPTVALTFQDGILLPDIPAMRTKPVSHKKIQADASAFREARDRSAGQPGSETVLTRKILDLVYAGNADQGIELLDLAWEKDLNGKNEYLRDLAVQMARSPYWSSVRAINGEKISRFEKAQQDAAAIEQKKESVSTDEWLKRLLSDDSSVHDEAVQQLEKRLDELKGRAGDLKPALLDQKSMRAFDASNLLEKLGLVSVPVFCSVIQDESVPCSSRSDALFSLGNVKGAEEQAMKLALDSWASDRSCLGRAVVNVLSESNLAPEAGKTVLLAALKDPMSIENGACGDSKISQVAEWACRGLEKYPTQDVVDELCLATARQDVDMSRDALQAIASIKRGRKLDTDCSTRHKARGK